MDDRLLLTAWKPIERTLKDDLKKWEKQLKQRSEAGKKSAESRKRKSTSVNDRQRASTDSVSVSVSVSDSVSDIKRKKEGIPSWEVFKDYSFNKLKELDKPRIGLYEFDLKITYETWVENGWKDGKGNEIKSWKQKISNYLRNDWIKPQKFKGIAF